MYTKIGGNLLNVSEYGTFLATITSICGIFIGLYYAAITSISGAIYARVPQNIRSLLLSEKMGSAYMRFLAMFTLFGITLLALFIMGGKPNPLTPSIIIVLSGFAVFSFIYLGMRAFTLFDPTSLATDVVLQLKKSLLRCVAGATYWDSPEFQNHERIKAEGYIDTLEVLADIAEKERHLSGQVLVEFCQKIIWFLRWNELEKSKIPSDSHWFQSTYKHPNWYQTSDTQTSLVDQAGTSLPAKVVKNHDWVEARLMRIIYRSLKLNLRENRFSLAQTLYESLDKYIGTCSYNGRLSYALNVVREISRVSEEQINKSLIKAKNKQSLEAIAVCDAVATLPITALLSFSRSVEKKNSTEGFFEKFKDFDWSLQDKIYQLGLSPVAVEDLEWLQSRIKFELHVERGKVTPDWYVKNLVFKKEAENFIQCVDSLFSDAIEIYADWSKKLLSTKRYWLAATCITREKEFLFKIEKHFKFFEKYWESILKQKRLDNYWPAFKPEKLYSRHKKRIAEIEIMSGEISASLIGEDRPDDYPDFAGQFLHYLSEAVFNALLNNDEEKVCTLFPLFFSTTFAQSQKLMPVEVKEEWIKENLTKVALTPILDLIDLSGYCILMAEYYGNFRIRKLIELFWSSYLGKSENLNQAQVDIIFALIVSLDLAYEIPHRNQYRFRWERAINNKLVKTVEYKSIITRDSYFQDKLKLHDSSLVRLFAEDEMAFSHNGIDIFYTYILKNRLSNEKRNLISRRKDLEDDLKHEEEFYAKHMKGES